MRHTVLCGTLALLVAVFLASACGDPQEGGTYPGEPMATIRGWVEVVRPVESEAPRACLLWSVTSSSPDVLTTADSPVSGSFPARFEIDLVRPPPDSALNDLGSDGRVGLSVVVAYDDRDGDGRVTFCEEGDPGQCEDGLLGGCPDHAVVWLPEEVRPGTYLEQFLGGTPPAGYHLMEVVRANPDFGDRDSLRPLDAGFDTEITIILSDQESDFEWPDFLK